MLATYKGRLTTSPHPDGQYLQLGISGVSDVLELIALESYRRNYSNALQAGDRTAQGRLTVLGGDYSPPYRWEITSKVNTLQMQLFEAMISVQESGVPFVLSDRVSEVIYTAQSNPVTWQSGSPTANPSDISAGYGLWNVFVSIDDSYKERQGGGWYLLQFSALELL